MNEGRQLTPFSSPDHGDSGVETTVSSRRCGRVPRRREVTEKEHVNPGAVVLTTPELQHQGRYSAVSRPSSGTSVEEAKAGGRRAKGEHPLCAQDARGRPFVLLQEEARTLQQG